MANAAAFGKRMATIGDNIERNTNALKQSVANKILSDLAHETPIDEGTARSNWQVSLNAARTDTLPRPGHSDPVQNTIDIGAAIIVTAKFGDVIHVVNSLPYIVPLNEGHSKQAPAGYVDAIVERARHNIAAGKVLNNA